MSAPAAIFSKKLVQLLLSYSQKKINDMSAPAAIFS
jgi:hypothetical protein